MGLFQFGDDRHGLTVAAEQVQGRGLPEAPLAGGVAPGFLAEADRPGGRVERLLQFAPAEQQPGHADQADVRRAPVPFGRGAQHLQGLVDPAAGGEHVRLGPLHVRSPPVARYPLDAGLGPVHLAQAKGAAGRQFPDEVRGLVRVGRMRGGLQPVQGLLVPAKRVQHLAEGEVPEQRMHEAALAVLGLQGVQPPQAVRGPARREQAGGQVVQALHVLGPLLVAPLLFARVQPLPDGDGLLEQGDGGPRLVLDLLAQDRLAVGKGDRVRPQRAGRPEMFVAEPDQLLPPLTRDDAVFGTGRVQLVQGGVGQVVVGQSVVRLAADHRREQADRLLRLAPAHQGEGDLQPDIGVHAGGHQVRQLVLHRAEQVDDVLPAVVRLQGQDLAHDAAVLAAQRIRGESGPDQFGEEAVRGRRGRRPGGRRGGNGARVELHVAHDSGFFESDDVGGRVVHNASRR